MTGQTPAPGYILHGRPYRESSLIIDAFTRDNGRVSLLAKGGRKEKSYRAILQPFRLIQFSWLGRSELKTMTSAEPLEPSLALSGKVLFCGLYLNELLTVFTEKHDEQSKLYLLYGSALASLADGGSVEKTLRLFECALLNEIGYGLQLECEADTGNFICPEKRYFYQVDKGPVESASDKDSVQGATLIGLRRQQLDIDCTLREAKQLMRKVIDHHLAGRRLSSRDLFQPSRQSE